MFSLVRGQKCILMDSSPRTTLYPAKCESQGLYIDIPCMSDLSSASSMVVILHHSAEVPQSHLGYRNPYNFHPCLTWPVPVCLLPFSWLCLMLQFLKILNPLGQKKECTKRFPSLITRVSPEQHIYLYLIPGQNTNIWSCHQWEITIIANIDR